MSITVERVAQTNPSGVLVRAGSVVCLAGRWYDVLEDTVFFSPSAGPIAPAVMGRIAPRSAP